MQTTHDLNTPLLDNYDAFTDPFFDHNRLRHMDKPLQLADGVEKNYKFPTFYQDVNTSVGIFFCNYDRAKSFMPKPEMHPVKMPGGRALVIFSCYIYREVSGVVPYNEIAMIIPTLANPALNVPLLPMIMPGLFSSFGYYVFSMPVTSLENQIRGVKIWGLPKVVQQIDIEDKDGQCVTKAYEESGEGPYFELHVPTAGKPKSLNQASDILSMLDGKLKRSQTRFKGDFQVNEFKQTLRNPSLKPDKPCLILGDSPSGKRLQELEIEPHPFQFRYCKNSMSTFDLSHT